MLFRSLEDYELFLYTFPHHKHIPPDIKHHCITAPRMSFHQPNIPCLIKEIAQLIESVEQSSE